MKVQKAQGQLSGFCSRPLHKWLILLIVTLFTVGCSDQASGSPPEVQLVTATTAALPVLPTQQTQAAPPTLVTPDIVQSATPEANCLPAETSPLRYFVLADLNWINRQVTVDQTITYRNQQNVALDNIVFHVEPNRLEQFNVMQLEGVYDESGTILDNIQLESTRLSVFLPRPLMPGCETTIRLVYQLQIPRNGDTVGGRFGYLGHTWRQVNLGHWLATLAYYDASNNEWITNRKYNIGEQTIPEMGDYRVTLQVSNRPESLQVAGPGQMSTVNDDTWIFELRQSRDFALSLSTEYDKKGVMVGNTLVELFYFPATQPPLLNSAEQALKAAEESLQLYNDLFGPYPYERLVIVEGDFPDGMEFTGLVFVSEAWFKNWNGRDESWLTIITVHEIAHQWWYALIANDQGNVPYLDESLATYSELLYFEHYYPESVAWWWDLRINRHPTTDPVDSTIYNFTTVRPYINAVYLRGAAMLHNVRERVGDEVFIQWLQDYAGNNRSRIVKPIDFWNSMPEAEYLLIQDIRENYLAAPDILPLPTATPGSSQEQNIREDSEE